MKSLSNAYVYQSMQRLNRLKQKHYNKFNGRMESSIIEIGISIIFIRISTVN